MNIARGALLALLMLPILEIFVLIQVGASIGVLPTILLLIGAASAGAFLLQTQGWSTWMRVQASLARGELPETELVDAAVIVAGGALLLLPGFLSDLAGLICLFPPTRKRVAAYLLRNRFGIPQPPGAEPDRGPATIEGEYRREK